jgi:molybdate transport system substrate-binding protein
VTAVSRCAGVALLTAALWVAPRPAAADEVVVSAAASLTDAFTAIGKAFTAAHPGTTVRLNFGASGALLRQIEQGAPVDVFASASPKEMDTLQHEGKVEAGTRATFAGNRLALVAPAKGGGPAAWESLATTGVKRVALSDPDSVPSGRYAKETLTRRGLWAAVAKKAVYGENVRQTLTYVAGGDVDAGIVFATDARIAAKRVRVVATAVPGKDHAPITYPAAVVAGAPNAPAARRFVQFLRGKEARTVLARCGFTSP